MRIFLALLLVCVASAALWASLDRPLAAPDWRNELKGVAYNPSSTYTDSQRRKGYPEPVIRDDLKQLSTVTRRIRTYSVDPGLDRVPAIAGEFGLKVALGVWLNADRESNEKQLAIAISVINQTPQAIESVIVGNETLLRGELSAAQLAGYIARVKKAIPRRIPVGTAEVWSFWLRHPELAKASDFLGIHLLPYWEGIKAAEAMDYVENRYGMIKTAFPGKPIVIAEAGWPAEGRIKKGAVPSAAMQGYFLRHFLTLAADRHYDYYAFEAYDQPWKSLQEGAVGAHWGIFDAARAPKFAFTGALTSFEAWRAYALAAVVGTLLLGLLVLALMPAIAFRGYLLLGGVVGLIVSGALLIVDASSLRYVNGATLAGATLAVPATLLTALLLVTETAEWVLALWRKRRKSALPGTLARVACVSIHVPTHNEPPWMVLQTLSALSRLEYPDFEVIVLDNNTRDEALWRPVESFCQSLGSRFRFFHFDDIRGFKAGALNKALELTDPAAQYIAVIDSDYQVAPAWLKTVMPGFADPKVAVIQAPQDYRDGNDSVFKALCYQEYTGFFRVGMVERNEHNAIIQHGTMCVIRRTALEEVGRWADWCITEDTELGLRLLEAGYTALYIPVSMGRGLIPDTYGAYKSQRYRWVYGAMQILKRHAASILSGRGVVNGRPARLSPAQRYHFAAGWLPWIADGLWLACGVFALIWTALMAVAPRHFDVPLAALSGVVLALFTIKTVKTVCVHRARVGAGVLGAVGAAFTGLALTYTVGRAVLIGLATSSQPFLRTPKCQDATPWTRIRQLAAVETVMLAGHIVAIGAAVMTRKMEDPAEITWVAALVVMSVPYVAAVALALVCTLKPGRRLVFEAESGAQAYQASKP